MQKKRNADGSNWDEKSVHRTSTDIENSGKLKIADNGNNRPTDIECRRSSTAEVTDVDKRNGNESVTTTDTNSDSLIVASSDTPPDTTNSSPNTRTCSPSHAGLNTNATNVNGMLKKNALKAALSLDPSALCRGTIPYEKIAFSPPPQRSSTPGSMEIKKVIFSHFFYPNIISGHSSFTSDQPAGSCPYSPASFPSTRRTVAHGERISM